MRVAVVSYVHGWYMDYIPLFVYAVNKSYPDYIPRIFVRHTIPDEIKISLQRLRKTCHFEIQEQYLTAYGERKDPAYKPYYLRWLIPHYSLADLDVAFICDIDLLMFPESPTMLEQRLEICKLNGLPFANYQRPDHPKYPPRVTGWHFILVSEYYRVVGELTSRLLAEDVDITQLKHSYKYSNGLGESQWGQESLLHYIIRECFGEVDISRQFPTHHGLHLGPLRANLHRQLFNGKSLDHFGLNTQYWFSIEAQKYARDPMVHELFHLMRPGKAKQVVATFLKDFQQCHSFTVYG